MPLESWEDAAPFASALAHAAAMRTMPPYLADASGSCGTLRDAAWLRDDEIATLEGWSAAGAPEGTPSGSAPVPRPPPALARVDLTLDPGVDYIPRADREDDYRCFLVDTELAADAFVTGFEVEPGEPAIVHHVVVWAPPDPVVESALATRDATDEGPGYECFGDAGDPRAVPIALWAPGSGATRLPDGTGLRLRAGSRIALQVHYNLLAGALPDRTTVDLELASAVEHEAVMQPLYDTGLSISARARDVEVSASAIFRLGTSTRVWGAAPHMHRLGKSLTVEAGGRCVLDLPRWDFQWQRFYWYEEPLELGRDEPLTLRCRYDNPTDRDVLWGDGTDDEMCIAFFYLSP